MSNDFSCISVQSPAVELRHKFQQDQLSPFTLMLTYSSHLCKSCVVTILVCLVCAKVYHSVNLHWTFHWIQRKQQPINKVYCSRNGKVIALLKWSLSLQHFS